MSVDTLSMQSSPFLSAQASPTASSDTFIKMLNDVQKALSELNEAENAHSDIADSNDSNKSSSESTSSCELNDKKGKKSKKIWKKEGKEKEKLKLKVNVKSTEGDTSAGTGKEKKPREIVLTAEQLEAIKMLLDAIDAKKGEGVTLMVEGVGKVVMEEKDDEDDKEERAQAAPEDLDDDDVGNDGHTVDEVDRLMALRKPAMDLADATPATFLAEKSRHRRIGIVVGYAQERAAEALYEEQVKEGLRMSRHAELNDEYEEGIKTGRLTAKMGRGRKSWRQRHIEIYGQFVYKKNVAKAWILDKGEMSFDAVKAALKKYGPIVLKAVGIVVLCVILKYVKFNNFPRFAEWVGAWGGSEDAGNELV